MISSLSIKASLVTLLVLGVYMCPITHGYQQDHCSISWTNVTLGDRLLISTPNYPYYYPSDLECLWRISSLDGISFAIKFKEFIINRDGDQFDLGAGTYSAHMEHNSMFGSFSGWIPSHVVAIMQTQTMWVSFVSDVAGARTGFELEIGRIESTVPCNQGDKWCDSGDVCFEETLLCVNYPECLNTSNTCNICDDIDFNCLSGVGCVSKSHVCDDVRQCLDGSDEWACYQCGTKLSNLTSFGPIYVSSPYYPESYRPNANCIWSFSAITAGTYVLTILDLGTEWWDQLAIGFDSSILEGDSIAIKLLEWHHPKTILFNSMAVWMFFTSNIEVQYRGFLMEVERKEFEVNCLPEEHLCYMGYGCLDPSHVCNAVFECSDFSDEWYWKCDYCPNTTLTIQPDELVEITSPFYPSYYPNSVDCFWFVNHHNHYGFIVITFLTVSLHYGSDILTIGTGNSVDDESLVFRLSGKAAPRIAIVNESDIWLRLTTDVIGQYAFGFHLTFRWTDVFVTCEDDEFRCDSGYGCVEQPFTCDSQPQCLDKSDEYGCDLCGDEELDLAVLNSLNLTSPRYPTQYPLTQDCTWVLTIPDDSVAVVEFLHLDTGPDYDKLYIAPMDTKFIYDIDCCFPGVYLVYSGTITPRALVITQMQFQIGWDPTVWSLTSNIGFALHITLEKPSNETCHQDDFVCSIPFGLMCLNANQKCDGRVLCPDGQDEQDCGHCGPKNIYLDTSAFHINMTSPGFPSPYYPNLDCAWAILAEEPNLVVIHIQEFQLERGFDFITFGNGREIWRETIGSLTGSTKVSSITSSASTMWIVLETDGTRNLNGYQFELDQVSSKNLDPCEVNNFHCTRGVCVTYAAKCDGFSDCVVNNADEHRCAYVHCPGSYLCDEVPGQNVSKCLNMDEVCDGDKGCTGGDDEKQCDIKRCPANCVCGYSGPQRLEVICMSGWDLFTLANLAKTSARLDLSDGVGNLLRPGLFKGLSHLQSLSLRNNHIFSIERGVFAGLHSVTWLDLSNNNISVLNSYTFEDMPLLQEIYLWHNPIVEIRDDVFIGAQLLRTLVLIREQSKTHRAVEVTKNGFRGIENLKLLYVDDHHLCCHFAYLDDCITLEPQPPLFMCGSLMQNSILRVSMWMLGLSALVGNTLVLFLRFREKIDSDKQSRQSFLVANLAVSDCLMGIYMIILATVDVYYGDEYFIYSNRWRTSPLCKFESFLSLISSEASVFFVTFITIDRFLCIVFPFSKLQFGNFTTKLAASLIWSAAFTLAVIPTIYAGPDSDLYDLSDVCIGLPLITRPSSYSIQSSEFTGPSTDEQTFTLPVPENFKPAWYFSIAIFLGVNLICFLTIMVCYVIMFITVKYTRSQVKMAGRDDDLKIAVRMAVIVGTDFLCWMPVIIMGLLSQTGAAIIPLQMYTWSVVFIIPINSSLNPYLYTIVSEVARRKASNKHSNMSAESTRSDVVHVTSSNI